MTPKGIVSERRRFDVSSSRLTLAAAAVAAVALAKGAFELVAFGIEVEAYAFNLFWAGANLAGDRSPRSSSRGSARSGARTSGCGRRVAVRVEGADARAPCRDGGPLHHRRRPLASPGRRAARDGRARLHDARSRSASSRASSGARRCGGALRAGLAFEGVSAEARRALVRIAFSSEDALAGAHDARTRSQLVMALHLLAGIVRAFLPPPDTPAPRVPRRAALRGLAWVGARGRVRGVVLDLSSGGLGRSSSATRPAEALPIVLRDGVRWARVAHARRVVPGVWRAGPRLPARTAPGRRGACLPCRLDRPSLSSHPRRDTQMPRSLRAALLAAVLAAPERRPRRARRVLVPLARPREHADRELRRGHRGVAQGARAEPQQPRGVAEPLLGAAARTARRIAPSPSSTVTSRRFPDDWQLAFEQARLLQWSRYAYRAKDAVRYLRMGLARRDDPARRRELARLLGRDRATLDEALDEYRRLARRGARTTPRCATSG